MRLLVLAILATVHSVLAQDGILGVGGFISPSPQLAEARAAAQLGRPDLSAVKVELQTTTGVKLHDSDCAPNGYYFIPVSDPGTYVLSVTTPIGWTFVPATATVVCSNNDCADSKDINFIFTGFAVEGALHGAGEAGSCGLKAAAPSGVQVTITSQNDPKQTKTVQSSSGSFKFTDVFPGSYIISAHHPDFDLAPKQIPVEVGYAAVPVSESFRVTGYRLSGRVTSASGSAVPGVQVLLYSTEPMSLSCTDAAVQGPAIPGKHLLCSSITDDKGEYKFNGVQCAQYTLLPLHTDTEAAFEIQPTSQDVVVQQGHLVVDKPFKVTGFSVSGRVVISAGQGLPDVEVHLNGKPATKTDSSGSYRLSRMQSATYTVTAHSEQYDFTPLKGIAISPDVKKLPDITVATVLLSGRVSFTDPSFAARPRLVVLSSEDGDFNQKLQAGLDGGFTTKLPPGSYRLAPVVLAEEKKAGLVLSPAYRDVVLGDKPVQDLVFTQARFAISGAVKCLGAPCGGSLKLRVVADKYDEQFDLSSIQQGKADAEGAVSFRLADLVPLGEYSLSVVAPGLCWEQDAVQVVLTSQDAAAPVLVQKGFVVKVKSTHAGILTATSAAGATTIQSVSPGKLQSICLSGSGPFQLLLESTCFLFGGQPVAYDALADAGRVVEFAASQALVQGQVKAAGGLEVPGVSIKLSSGKEVTAAADTQPGTFWYQFYADLGSQLEVQPVVAGALAYPKSQAITVPTTACPPAVKPFTLQRGVTVKGNVSPSIEGVTVKVAYKGASAAGGVGAAGQLVGSFLTDAQGNFEVGPLYDDVEYDVSVEKTGYRFKVESQPPASATYQFVGEQLASVTVTVELASTGDLGGVLLSFSGDRGFRQNAKLGQDGTHTFYDMLPGTFYLRPQLREYAFEPAVAEVVVEEGGTHSVKFGSKRTAFSVMGTARAINGQVLGGVVVEALLDGVVKESSISGEDGSYRIQGLSPGQQYTLAVRTSSSVLKAFPNSHQVVMKAADQQGVDFTAFSSAPQLVVSGAVDVPDPLLRTTLLQVLRADTQQWMASLPLDASKYYQVKLPSPGQYVLRLTCGSLSPDAYITTNATITVESSPVQAPPLVLTQHASRMGAASEPGEGDNSSLTMRLLVAAGLLGLAVWKNEFLAELFQVGPALS